MPKHWRVGQSTDVYKYIKTNKDIKVGDTISYVSDNQLGAATYRVYTTNNNKKKRLETIEDYGMLTDKYSSSPGSGSKKSGGKKTLKNKSKKRKTRKN